MCLPIVIGVYAFIVVFLPQQPLFERLYNIVIRLDPNIAFVISIALGSVSAFALWLIWRKPNGYFYEHPSRRLAIANSGLIGVLFSSVFDLFEHLSGLPVNLINMILIPAAFMIAESVYQFYEANRAS